MRKSKSRGQSTPIAVLTIVIVGPLLILEALLHVEQTGLSLVATIVLSVLLAWLVCTTLGRGHEEQ